MSNNYVLWEHHYREILTDIYRKLSLFLLIRNSKPPSYSYFSIFCYNNTKKTVYYNRQGDKYEHALII